MGNYTCPNRRFIRRLQDFLVQLMQGTSGVLNHGAKKQTVKWGEMSFKVKWMLYWGKKLKHQPSSRLHINQLYLFSMSSLLLTWFCGVLFIGLSLNHL